MVNVCYRKYTNLPRQSPKYGIQTQNRCDNGNKTNKNENTPMGNTMIEWDRGQNYYKVIITLRIQEGGMYIPIHAHRYISISRTIAVTYNYHNTNTLSQFQRYMPVTEPTHTQIRRRIPVTAPTHSLIRRHINVTTKTLSDIAAKLSPQGIQHYKNTRKPPHTDNTVSWSCSNAFSDWMCNERILHNPLYKPWFYFLNLIFTLILLFVSLLSCWICAGIR